MPPAEPATRLDGQPVTKQSHGQTDSRQHTRKTNTTNTAGQDRTRCSITHPHANAHALVVLFSNAATDNVKSHSLSVWSVVVVVVAVVVDVLVAAGVRWRWR